jgi:sulfonate transport system substrate-binding protein
MAKLMRSILTVVLPALAAALLLFSVAKAEDAVTIRIGFASIGEGNRQFTGNSAAALAHAQGWLEEEFKGEPVKIAWSFFKGAGPAVNEAIANKQLDFAVQGDLPSVIGRANGLKTKILMANGAHVPTYLAVPADSPLKSVKDLKGKKVAIFRGTNYHLSAVKVLAANGLTERDLQILNMDSAAATAGLISKDVDAAFGIYFVPLIDKGIAKVIYTTKGDSPAFERHSALLGTEDFIAKHPDLTYRIVKIFVKAAEWASHEGNREALFEIWSKSGYPPSSFRYDYDGQLLAYRNSPLIDGFIVQQYAFQAQQAKEYGLIRRDADVKGWFDPSFLNRALDELKLQNFWTQAAAAAGPAQMH